MRIWYCFIFILGVCHSVEGQLTIGSFLQSATVDPKIKGFKEQVRYMNEKPYRLSLLQRLELRMQNRELQPSQQEYGIRFTPANPWEVRSNNRYYKAFTSSLSLESEIIFKEILLERYYCVINYLFHQEMVGLLKAQEKLIQDQIFILEKQSGSSYFDADEYLDLHVDYLDVSVEAQESEFERMNATDEVDRLYLQNTGALNWDVNNVIQISRIKSVVDSLTNTSLRNILVEYQQQQINVANSEYKLEKSNINLGFIQTEFDERRVDQDRTPFNIALGITIPITNPNKGDMARRKLEVIDAQHELEEAKNIQRSGASSFQEKIYRLIERYDHLTTKMVSLQNSTLATTLSTLKGGDPRFVIRFHENQVKLKVMLAKLRRDTLIAYVDYLAFSDKLQQEPLINYFSGHLEQLK